MYSDGVQSEDRRRLLRAHGLRAADYTGAWVMVGLEPVQGCAGMLLLCQRGCRCGAYGIIHAHYADCLPRCSTERLKQRRRVGCSLRALNSNHRF